MDKNYKQFVEKLNAYIQKFYLYQLVRGFILFVLLFLSYYSFISLLEYLSYFDPKIKLIIILVTLFFTFVIFIYFVFIPVIKLIGLGKRISYYDISSQLSESFPEIKDKLINIIELENDSNANYSLELKRASIDQKIGELKIYKFSDSIRFKDLRRVFSLFSVILLIVALIFWRSPEFYKDSSVRLIHFQQKYEKPAPYTFNLETKRLDIITGESVELELKCSGRELPEMMYVNLSGNNYLMKRNGELYSYTIENVNSSVSFYFTDKKYLSEIYRIHVINKPFVSSFSVEVQPPAYTGLPSEKLQNIGDLKLVSGSTVKWIFKTADTDSLFLIFSDSSKVVGKATSNGFEAGKIFYNSLNYKILVKNSKLLDENNLVYKVQTLSDLYPEIKVVQIQDSTNYKIFHFKGNIIDDYGFNKLEFNISADGKDTVFQVPVVPFMLNQDFYYSFDFESVKSFGKSFKYFFTVYDNDFINHFKKSISETFVFAFPDYNDILTKEISDQNSLDQLFNKSSKLADEIQQQFKNFKLKQINSELSGWEKFQMVKDIMNKKNDLENVLDQINRQNKDANNFLNSFTNEKSDILKKQEQIEDLLKDVFTDELKKLFDEFNDLAKQFDSKKFDQLSKDMGNHLDDLSKQLEKNVQLLKRMKVEQKIERVLEGLKNLSIKEKENLNSVENRSDLERLGSAEQDSKKLVEDLQKDYNSANELNKELEKPLKMFDFSKEFLELKENFDKVQEQISNNSKRKAKAEIEKNVKSIDQLMFAMQQMLNSGKAKQNQENLDNIKQILNNLVIVSFGQENILRQFNSVDFNNPMINDLKVRQRDLQNQVSFVKDSLYALSKRSPQIGSVVNKEMLSLENNVGFAFDNIETGNMGGTRMYQQYSVTAANNLALFLSEALENIKEQEKNSQPGEGECDKPGSKAKKSMQSLKESEKSIKDQLQKMIEEMKKGENGKLSKSIGQTIAQQEIMQQLIREMMNNGTVGTQTTNQLKLIDQLLEQSRKDLINKNISSELINRQNLILSKLLDAEKAEIEREYEEKRESTTGKDEKKVNPQTYFEYKNQTKNESELLKRDHFRLKSFYDQKFNSYINRLKN